MIESVTDYLLVTTDGTTADTEGLDGALELARPLPDGRLEVYAVSTRVNNARNQDADLTDPLSTPA